MNEIESLLDKARRSFDVAETTLEQGHADFAISRAYYGCFYIAQAMLLSQGLEYASHGQVVAQFGLHFAKARTTPQARSSSRNGSEKFSKEAAGSSRRRLPIWHPSLDSHRGQPHR